MASVDYSKMVPPPLRTRTATEFCLCLMCQTGKNVQKNNLVYKEVAEGSKIAPIKICKTCAGEIAPGVSHICNRTSRNDNIQGIIRSLSGKSQGQIVAQVLKGM